MKQYVKIIVFVLAIMYIGGSTGVAEEYRIGPRDVLSIDVWGLSGQAESNGNDQAQGLIVRPDGKIAFPMVGELQAAGLTPGELSQAIETSLNGYFNNPRVTINILKYHTTRVYVVGEVPKPGLYELDKQHNLMDAIASAGGYTKDTAKKKVYIISSGSTTPLKVNLLQLLNKGDMTQNVCLKDGDIVYMTNNHRVDIARDIFPIIAEWSFIRNF